MWDNTNVLDNINALEKETFTIVEANNCLMVICDHLFDEKFTNENGYVNDQNDTSNVAFKQQNKCIPIFWKYKF